MSRKTETKGLLQSKTTWGVVVMILAFGAQRWFNINISEATLNILNEEVAVVAGAILTIVGRIKASKPIDGVY